tara:strand:+ start:765 stop:1172 length:408 start_codon:yes stop_codon:yes gene_type:complete
MVRRNSNNNVSVEEIDDTEIPFIHFNNGMVEIMSTSSSSLNIRDDIILHPIIVALTHSMMVGDGLPMDLDEEKNKLTDDQFRNLETCSEVTNCVICMENKKANIKLKCNHIFCKGCIKKWLTEKSNTCPNCRTEI